MTSTPAERVRDHDDDPDDDEFTTDLVPVELEEELRALVGTVVDGWDDEDDEDYPPPLLVEHAAYVIEGARYFLEKRRAEKNVTVYEQRAERALAEADHATAQEWIRIGLEKRGQRDARKQERKVAFWAFVDALPRRSKIGSGTFVAASILWAGAKQDATQLIAPTEAVLNAISETAHVVSVTWQPAALSALAISAVVGGWRAWALGRANAAQSPLDWVAAMHAPADQGSDPITPSVLVVAFRDLGLSALKKAIVDMPDAGAAMLTPIYIAGCGVEVDVKLPTGVSTEEIQNRRRKLAENLGRHEHEVFITIPPRPRTVRLWIADSGALDEPIGPSPLVTDLQIKADMYYGRAPWGQTLRGDTALVSLLQRHVLATGKSNQGKTASLRALALWLLFDATVEFRISDLKGVGDWRMFDGLATVLIQGPTDDHVLATVEMVEATVEEMNDRLIRLEKSGASDGVTRDMARAGIDFHPIVVLVDEAQVAYMCPAKDEAGNPLGGQSDRSRFATAVRKIHNQGRAVNVTMWQGTQDPTDRNLPKIVREGAHLRAGLALGTESQARMALGEAPVDAGAAPHKLRDGFDKGTLVAVGDAVDIPAGQPSITIRTHYVSGAEAATVADRARKVRAAVATRSALEEKQAPRNLFADLAEVLNDHDERIRLTAVTGLLAKLAPGYRPYDGFTAQDLAMRLSELGVAVTNSGNVLRLDPKHFREVYARRASGAS